MIFDMLMNANDADANHVKMMTARQIARDALERDIREMRERKKRHDEEIAYRRLMRD